MARVTAKQVIFNGNRPPHFGNWDSGQRLYRLECVRPNWPRMAQRKEALLLHCRGQYSNGGVCGTILQIGHRKSMKANLHKNILLGRRVGKGDCARIDAQNVLTSGLMRLRKKCQILMRNLLTPFGVRKLTL